MKMRFVIGNWGQFGSFFSGLDQVPSFASLQRSTWDPCSRQDGTSRGANNHNQGGKRLKKYKTSARQA